MKKCIRISVLIPACPGQPSTGQLRGPPLVGKAIRYVCGSPPVAEASQLHRSSASCPCCVTLWCVNYPAAISFLDSLHCTRSLCRSRYVGPSPVIFLPYASADCVPAAWQGRQTMLTVFPTLVHRPTLSNKLTSVSKDHCSQRRPDDATMPSSAQNRAAWRLPSFPLSPFFHAFANAIVTQWRTTASTTTLNMVGDSGSHCVTP